MSSGYVASGLSALANFTQVGAYQISSLAYLNQFTAVTAILNSCLLPINPSAGQICKIRNDSTTGNGLVVFPQVGGIISGFVANAQYVIAVGGVIEFTSIGSLNWVISSISNNQQIFAMTAGGTIVTSMNGAVINATQAAGTITLPLAATAQGFRIRIQISTSAAGVLAISAGAASACIRGTVIDATLAGALQIPVTNSSAVNFIANNLNGSYLDFICDGVNYYVSGMTKMPGGITLTA